MGACRCCGRSLVPLAVASAVNYAKFGMLFGVSNFDQVWTTVNAYRRQFLAANHNSESGPSSSPTHLLTYLRPDGIHLSSLFPFVTLPTAPPTALGGVLFDRLYRTASIPASMPLLFLLGCWGAVTAFRPRSVGRVHLMRILLLAAAGAAGLLVRLGVHRRPLPGRLRPVLRPGCRGRDCRPLAEAGRSQPRDSGPAWCVIATLGAFCVVANFGIAVTPNEEWNTTQALHFVQTQKAVAGRHGPVAPSARCTAGPNTARLGARGPALRDRRLCRTLHVERRALLDGPGPAVHADHVAHGRAGHRVPPHVRGRGSVLAAAPRLPSWCPPARRHLRLVTPVEDREERWTSSSSITKQHGYRASVALPVLVHSAHRIEVVVPITAKHLGGFDGRGRRRLRHPDQPAGPIQPHGGSGIPGAASRGCRWVSRAARI